MFESNETLWRRPGLKSVGIAAVVAVFVALRAMPGGRHHYTWPFTLGLAAASFFFMLALTLRANAWPRLVPARVVVDDQRLLVGERVVPRARIRSAVLVPGSGPGKPYVRVLVRNGLPIEIGVASAEEGQALLRALARDASQHASEFQAFSLRTFFFAMFGIAPLVLVAARLHFVLSPPLAMVAMVVALAASYFAFRMTVGVGADGVSIRKLGRSRFIKTQDIDAVTADGVIGATILLKTGEQVKIPFGGRGFEKEGGNKEAAAFIERVEEAVRVYKEGAIESASALLDRGSRDWAEWVRTLRTIGAGANATLRTAAIDAARLARVVESPAARPIDRAAAAIAVQSSDDEDAKNRVRVAAAAIADQRLRVAIEAASTDDDEHIEAMLEALDERPLR